MVKWLAGMRRVFSQCIKAAENSKYPASNWMFKVNNRNTKTKSKICSKLTIKTPKRLQWRCSHVFIVNFEYIPHLVLVFLLLTLCREMPAKYELVLAKDDVKQLTKQIAKRTPFQTPIRTIKVVNYFS